MTDLFGWDGMIFNHFDFWHGLLPIHRTQHVHHQDLRAHLPSVRNTVTPNLYLTAVMSSGGFRCNTSVGDGTTISQASAVGSPRDPILACQSLLCWSAKVLVIPQVYCWACLFLCKLVTLSSHLVLACNFSSTSAVTFGGHSSRISCFSSWEARSEVMYAA